MAVTCTGEGRVLRAAISGEVDHHRARAIMEELSRQIDPQRAGGHQDRRQRGGDQLYRTRLPRPAGQGVHATAAV